MPHRTFFTLTHGEVPMPILNTHQFFFVVSNFTKHFKTLYPKIKTFWWVFSNRSPHFLISTSTYLYCYGLCTKMKDDEIICSPEYCIWKPSWLKCSRDVSQLPSLLPPTAERLSTARFPARKFSCVPFSCSLFSTGGGYGYIHRV